MSVDAIRDAIQEHDAQYVDVRFTGTDGQWHKLTYHVSQISDSFFNSGVMIDGSSIKGWKTINASDVRLVPDACSFMMDPFSAQKTLILLGIVEDPTTNTPYEMDPRSIAKKAEAFVAQSQIADTAYFGPEPEFFVFDGVEYGVSGVSSYVNIMSDEIDPAPREGRHSLSPGHHAGFKGGYFADAPIDTAGDLRSEMLSTLVKMGVRVEKHHHEVAAAQHELGISYSTLVQTADWIQTYKYVVKNVAQSYGKTATFMPKPIMEDSGSGMHVHLSLWKAGQPLFSGDQYAGLSEEALYYIGGILKHARALTAFTNPTINSYKRLVPGFEAPVNLAYSLANRSAACRIPVTNTSVEKRVEIRFPDPSANPYLALAALTMAGMDGIRQRIHPGEAVDHNLYEEGANAQKQSLSESLMVALGELMSDHEFLTQGDVFTEQMIASYVATKYDECLSYQKTPQPMDFKLYYSC